VASPDLKNASERLNENEALLSDPSKSGEGLQMASEIASRFPGRTTRWLRATVSVLPVRLQPIASRRRRRISHRTVSFDVTDERPLTGQIDRGDRSINNSWKPPDGIHTAMKL
jgi:hypothetical protein